MPIPSNTHVLIPFESYPQNLFGWWGWEQRSETWEQRYIKKKSLIQPTMSKYPICNLHIRPRSCVSQGPILGPSACVRIQKHKRPTWRSSRKNTLPSSRRNTNCTARKNPGLSIAASWLGNWCRFNGVIIQHMVYTYIYIYVQDQLIQEYYSTRTIIYIIYIYTLYGTTISIAKNIWTMLCSLSLGP